MSSCPRKDIKENRDNLLKEYDDALYDVKQAQNALKEAKRALGKKGLNADYKRASEPASLDELKASYPKNSKNNDPFETYSEWNYLFKGAGNKIENALSGDNVARAINSGLKAMKIPDNVADFIIKERPAVQKAIESIAYNFNKFRNNVNGNAKLIYDGLKDTISEAENVSLFKALAGELDPKELGANLQNAYTKYRTLIDEKAKELVELGALDKDFVIKDYVKFYYDNVADGAQRQIYASTMGFKNQRVYARGDASYEQKVKKGLKEDAAFAVAMTIKEQNIQIEKAKIFKYLADNYSTANKIDGLAQVPKTQIGGGLEQYGALAGRYVEPELLAELKSAQALVNNLSGIERVWHALVQEWKLNKTIKNIPTHFRNIIGNVITAYGKGDLLAVSANFAKLSQKEFKKEWEQWLKLGRLYGVADNIERLEIGLKENSKLKTLTQKAAKIDEKMGGLLYASENSKLGKALRNLYALEDVFFKLTHFKKLMDSKGFDISRLNDSEYMKNFDELLKLAGKRANEAYVDYDASWSWGGGLLGNTLPKMARRHLDQKGVMPFIQYTYKSAPIIFKDMLKNPVRYAGLQLALYAGGASVWLGNKDEIEQENLGRPAWAKNTGANMYGAKSYIDISDEHSLNIGGFFPGFGSHGVGDSITDLSGGLVGNVAKMAMGERSLGGDITRKQDKVAYFADDGFLINRVKDAQNLMIELVNKAEYSAQSYGPGYWRPIMRGSKLAYNNLTNSDMANANSSGKQIKSFGELLRREAGSQDFDEQSNAKKAYNADIAGAKRAMKKGELELAKKYIANAKHTLEVAKRAKINTKNWQKLPK